MFDHEKSDNYIHTGHYYRGLVISEFGGLEATIELFLTNYFLGTINQKPYNEKRSELKNIVLDRLTFESKRAAFKSIMDKKHIADGFKKTSNNKYPLSDLFNEIRMLNEQRVYFAHYRKVSSSTPHNYVIGLNEQRDSPDILWYTKEDITNLIKRIRDVIEVIREIGKSIGVFQG